MRFYHRPFVIESLSLSRIPARKKVKTIESCFQELFFVNRYCALRVKVTSPSPQKHSALKLYFAKYIYIKEIKQCISFVNGAKFEKKANIFCGTIPLKRRERIWWRDIPFLYRSQVEFLETSRSDTFRDLRGFVTIS